jgi:transcriptional regulator with XRE-family HTH domain
MPNPPSPPDDWHQFGRTVRERRREQHLTMVELATRCELSQPFLSQIENGRAKPSMDSIYRIAHALDTTPQALFGDRAGAVAEPTVVRRDDPAVTVLDRGPESQVRLVLPGAAPFHVLEFDGLPAQFEQFWRHDGFEAIYVVAGRVEVSLDDERITLEAGDFLSYPSSRAHSHRSLAGPGARIVLIESTADAGSQHRSRAHTHDD